MKINSTQKYFDLDIILEVNTYICDFAFCKKIKLLGKVLVQKTYNYYIRHIRITKFGLIFFAEENSMEMNIPLKKFERNNLGIILGNLYPFFESEDIFEHAYDIHIIVLLFPYLSYIFTYINFNNSDYCEDIFCLVFHDIFPHSSVGCTYLAYKFIEEFQISTPDIHFVMKMK